MADDDRQRRQNKIVLYVIWAIVSLVAFAIIKKNFPGLDAFLRDIWL